MRATIRYGQFEVVLGPDGQPDELGSGAMATTYRARDTVLQNLVALKIISKKIAGDSIVRSRFLREARAAAKLRHPNVGSVFHYGEQDGECYYVMELIGGETLAERVRSKGVFTPKQALEVGVQVARALAAAESVGLVHRDVKPSNLMLEFDPDADKGGGDQDTGEGERIHIKVIDWGLAKLRSTALVETALRPKNVEELVMQRASLLKAAVEKDPNFFRAYSELVVDLLWLYEHRMRLPPDKQAVDYRGLADSALAQARRLQPDSGLAHLATAYVLYIGSRDPDQAWVEAELAQKSLPNNLEVYQLMGYIAYGRGRWREATESLERACALDPSNWDLRLGLSQYYRKLRRPTDYEREWQQARDAMPPETRDLFDFSHAAETVEQTGDLGPLRKALGELPSASDPDGRLAFVAGFLLHLFERDPNATAQTLVKYTADPIRSGYHLYPRAWFEVRLDWLRGDDAQAQRDLTLARDWMAKQVIADPTDGWKLSMLALFDAGLGRKEDATQEALRAVDLEPSGPRYLDQGSLIQGNLALVYAWTGQTSQAFDVLESAADKPGTFDVPSQPSYGDLVLNPCWDSLRTDPRFKGVLARFQKPVPGS
ncbi:MAG: protein kinase [Verrucomicrobia bacterium]|nr:protein kinase [Verrucomicrobiota bacterium]